MNWNPFRKKEETESIDPLDITLDSLKPGYVLDYDLKTWQVSAHHYYEYDGDRVDEWELSSADEVVYLECEKDDGVAYTLTRKIRVSEFDADIPAHINQDEDPPEEIAYKGIVYEADSSAIGRYYQNGEGTGDEFIVWDYLDDSEKRTLSIEQWSDDRFEASVGEIVEDYQFSNILPGEAT
ncbi:MAG: DUF4178 domain-containing protein [Candidatus Latescibacteria bacterium]|jgi:hypothetical protein|nr:DUF4178 domain-containing protein [Candidatus Latescibacterota bacterium]MBT4139440.1 DUF4178 domain-containing protein [Candidatus Latescibacterota bacterium]MBT5829033.1 DUF4178 domain-containing protein [Candidatus Latescibacterota bacterium]